MILVLAAAARNTSSAAGARRHHKIQTVLRAREGFTGRLSADAFAQKQYMQTGTAGNRAALSEIKKQKEGDTVVELDQFKTILGSYTEPLVEVRDSL